jgi:hypothetical protein
MASDGTRVFVLGGLLWSESEWAHEAKLIHIVDTSTYSRFCHLIWTASKFQNRAHRVPETRPQLC